MNKKIVFTVLVLLSFVLVSIATANVTAQAATTDPENVEITSLTSSAFTVSWTTGAECTGSVMYGSDPASITNIVNDRRGAETESITHYVEIGGLAQNTTYYFKVRCGDTIYPTTGYWSVKTKVADSTELTAGIRTLMGRLIDETGAAEGALAYCNLTQKNVVAISDITEDGWFFISISVFGNVTGTGFYHPQLGDEFRLNVRTSNTDVTTKTYTFNNDFFTGPGQQSLGYIYLANTALGDGGVTPTSGNSTTNFNFTASYFAASGGAVPTVEVVVDGQAYAMKADPSDSDSTDGIQYYQTLTFDLAPGNYTYYFRSGTLTTQGSGGSEGTITIVPDTVVDEPDEDDDWLLIGGVAAVVIVIVLVLFFMKSKKAPSEKGGEEGDEEESDAEEGKEE